MSWFGSSKSSNVKESSKVKTNEESDLVKSKLAFDDLQLEFAKLLQSSNSKIQQLENDLYHSKGDSSKDKSTIISQRIEIDRLKKFESELMVLKNKEKEFKKQTEKLFVKEKNLVQLIKKSHLLITSIIHDFEHFIKEFDHISVKDHYGRDAPELKYVYSSGGELKQEDKVRAKKDGINIESAHLAVHNLHIFVGYLLKIKTYIGQLEELSIKDVSYSQKNIVLEKFVEEKIKKEYNSISSHSWERVDPLNQELLSALKNQEIDESIIIKINSEMVRIFREIMLLSGKAEEILFNAHLVNFFLDGFVEKFSKTANIKLHKFFKVFTSEIVKDEKFIKYLFSQQEKSLNVVEHQFKDIIQDTFHSGKL